MDKNDPARDPMASENRTTPPEDEPRAKRIAIEVDPELTLEARICRLEELEMLRVAIYQAELEMQKAIDTKNAAVTSAVAAEADRQVTHWKSKMQEGQRKIGDLLNAIGQTVRGRLNVRDFRSSVKG